MGRAIDDPVKESLAERKRKVGPALCNRQNFWEEFVKPSACRKEKTVNRAPFAVVSYELIEPS
jgi:hypothetical protein